MSNESDSLYSNETISVIDDDEEFEEEEKVDIDDEVNDEEIDNKDVDNEEVDINRVDDNENDQEVDKEADNNNKLKKSTTSFDVWDYVDKIERKCPYCAKIFGKKTGISSIQNYLGGHSVKFEKQLWIVLLKNIPQKFKLRKHKQ